MSQTTPTQPADLLAHVEVLKEMFAVCANERRMKEADALSAAIESLAAHRGGVAAFRRHYPEGGHSGWYDAKFESELLAALRKSCNIEYAYTHPPQAQAVAGDAGMARIGELIRTQDNRIIDQPIFIVQQKRRIFGMDEDYAEDFMWYDARAVESYDEAGKAERDADREAEGLPPIEWHRGGYIDTWEFVTACFTEQGCKDYIARDGHNLREARIYATGSYRNEEFRAVRKYLAALEAKP